jgi:hypothetical protein
MHVLSRRAERAVHAGAAGRSYVLRPPRAGAGDAAAARVPARSARPAGPSAGAYLLLVLLAGALLAVPGVVVAAVLGVVPAGWTAVPPVALGLLVAALRGRARRRRAVRATSARRRPAPRPAAPPVATSAAAAAGRLAASATPPPTTTSSPIKELATATAAASAAGRVREPAAGSWTPVPVPPPTYTLKPPAPRRVALERAEPVAAVAPAAPQAPAWDLDAVLERRRAVNA